MVIETKIKAKDLKVGDEISIAVIVGRTEYFKVYDVYGQDNYIDYCAELRVGNVQGDLACTINQDDELWIKQRG